MSFNISSKKVDLNDKNYINKLSKSALKLISESNTLYYVSGERCPEIIIIKNIKKEIPNELDTICD